MRTSIVNERSADKLASLARRFIIVTYYVKKQSSTYTDTIILAKNRLIAWPEAKYKMKPIKQQYIYCNALNMLT